MPYIVLIPAIVCTIALFLRPLPWVFTRVYLVFFLLCPGYYFWKAGGLPPISFSEAALLPIGIALVAQTRKWRFTPMDLCMAAFVLSSCVADWQRGNTSISIFQLVDTLLEALVPYMIGKTLLEQGDYRFPAVRRMVELLAVCGILSLFEYRMEQNPFTMAFGRFFPDEHFAWKTQLRWGFGRVSGPFAQSELAGMVFLFGVMMAVWLSYARPAEDRFSLFPRLPFRKSTVLIGILALTLLATQARGPWLGCLLSLPIALVGRSRRILRNSILAAVILLPLAAVGYFALSHYAQGAPMSAEQETAKYRSDLLTNYIPIARRGGSWGWGMYFPRVAGQTSIDNEYLFVTLMQGYVGLAAVCLISLQTLGGLALAGLRMREPQDRSFAYSLLGVFAGLLFTIFTAFFTNQPMQLFFMIAGWSQALYFRSTAEKAPQRQPLFEYVYT